jgi:Multiple myeloma tumor-associated
LWWILSAVAVLVATVFKWADVKTDKHRENYLGHSLSAPVGRWQKGEACKRDHAVLPVASRAFFCGLGKDLTWWNRGKLNAMDAINAEKARDEELARIRAQENDMLMEALCGLLAFACVAIFMWLV